VTEFTRVRVKVAKSTSSAKAHGLNPSAKPATSTVGTVSPPNAAVSKGTANR
jgi:hypothetical protein